jgi:D-alanine-D-alanine ligase
MTEKLRLGVIFGGKSNEHEVSVVSAVHIVDACDPERFEVVPIGISNTGAWIGADESVRAIARARIGHLRTVETDASGLLSNPEALSILRTVDAVFPITHGTNGEDGTLQGLLELAGIPYVGAGVAASAVGMDKVFQKQVWAQAGIPVVDYQVVHEQEWRQDRQEVLNTIARQVPYPAFVKPANAGSSVGVSKVRSREDFATAVEMALEHDSKVLIEQAIQGREIECAVLGNVNPEAAPLGEVIPDREFYDYDAKYAADSRSQFVTPADLPVVTADTIKKIAIMAYKAIDCAGMGRVDFFLTDENIVFVNEINTLPGFTPISGFPKMWQAAGVSYRDLISRLVDLALERHAEKRARAGKTVHTP